MVAVTAGLVPHVLVTSRPTAVTGPLPGGTVIGMVWPSAMMLSAVEVTAGIVYVTPFIVKVLPVEVGDPGKIPAALSAWSEIALPPALTMSRSAAVVVLSVEMPWLFIAAVK